jgi:Ca2+-binding RTX toxin-like protein
MHNDTDVSPSTTPGPGRLRTPVRPPRRLAVLALVLAVGGLLTACDPTPPRPIPPNAPSCQGLRPTIIGTEGRDRITGTGERDVIHALGGDDYVNAVAGNDVVCGGTGKDELLGGADADVIDGGQDPGNVLIGQTGADIVSYSAWTTGVTVNLFDQVGGSGDRILDVENVTGTPHFDHITGDNAPNHLNGFGGGDMIYGLGGDDTLLPGGVAGQDTYLVPGNGNDYVEGGAASDMVAYTDGPAVVADLGTGWGRTGGGVDRLIAIDGVHGSKYDDTIYGGPGDDEINAEAGNDLVDGRGGNDLVDGHMGVDTATWSTASTGVIVDLAAGSASGQGVDTIRDVENVTGSRWDDALSGTSGPNVINGSSGVDLCVGNGGGDTLRDCP